MRIDSEQTEIMSEDDSLAAVHADIDSSGPAGLELVIIAHTDNHVTVRTEMTPHELAEWLYHFGVALVGEYPLDGWPGDADTDDSRGIELHP